MPWERNDNKGMRPDRPRERCLEVFADSRDLSGRLNGWVFFPRASAAPQPWAGVSRPVGPGSAGESLLHRDDTTAAGFSCAAFGAPGRSAGRDNGGRLRMR